MMLRSWLGALALLAMPVSAMAVCGDGVPEAVESCDDGNLVDGDGCSSTCDTEPGFVCECAAGEPLVLTQTLPTAAIGATSSMVGMGACPEGEVLQGITGTFVDNCPGVVISVDLLCAETAINTADGSVILSQGTLVPGARPDATGIDLPQSSYTLTCPGNQAVTGFTGESGIAVPFDSRRRAGVSELELQCSDLAFTDGEIVTAFGGLAGPPVAEGNPLPGDTTIACDDGEVAVGVAGWGVDYLDGARLMCATATPACAGGNACRPEGVCGDGIVDAGEICDDGNDIAWDDCTTTCELPACGDGILSLGEACDDGNSDDTDACTNSCQLTGCGNGILEFGEACDDGNFVDNDGCSITCTEECTPGQTEDLVSGNTGRTFLIEGLNGDGSTDRLSVVAGVFDLSLDFSEATYTGTAIDTANPGSTWEFTFFFAFRGMGDIGAGPSGPFLPRVSPTAEQLDAWLYFDTTLGEMVNQQDGRVLRLAARPADGSQPVQVGVGADTYSLDYGIAGMFGGPLYQGDGTYVRNVEAALNATMEPLHPSCSLTPPCVGFLCTPYEICDGVDNDGDGDIDEGFTSTVARRIAYSRNDITDSTIVFDPATNSLDYSIEVLHENGDPADAFTVAINDGGNPKGHGDLALLYFDATGPTPLLTAYAYNGLNGDSSFMDGADLGGVQPPDPILGLNDAATWIQDIYVVDTGTSLRMGFVVDATLINTHTPMYQESWDWYGIGIGNRAGQWLHVFNDVSTSYNAAGFLDTFNAMGSDRWIDSGNDRTEEVITCPPLPIIED